MGSWAAPSESLSTFVFIQHDTKWPDPSVMPLNLKLVFRGKKKALGYFLWNVFCGQKFTRAILTKKYPNKRKPKWLYATVYLAVDWFHAESDPNKVLVVL